MNCPSCDVPMIRRKSNFKPTFWWGCSNWPECDVKAEEHPDGTLMSYPAGADVQKLRRRAHQLLEKVFGEWSKKSKPRMYGWLKFRVKEGHIGKATKQELEVVIKLLEKKI